MRPLLNVQRVFIDTSTVTLEERSSHEQSRVTNRKGTGQDSLLPPQPCEVKSRIASISALNSFHQKSVNPGPVGSLKHPPDVSLHS